MNQPTEQVLFDISNFPTAKLFIDACLSGKYSVVVYGGAVRGGKANPLDSEIVTPFGVRTMGDMKIGSQVSNPDGTISRVIAVHPQGKKEIYEVKFVDGTSVECCGEHLWNYHRNETKVKAKREYGLWKTATILQMKKMMETTNVSIPITKPVIFTRGKKMPIDPYLLGLILGDGCITQPSSILYSSNDQFLIDEISKLVTRVSVYKDYNYRIIDDKLKEDLRKFGLMGCDSETKFIPNIYLHSSIAEREEIVKGLMDTDGYMDDRGHAEYTTVSKQLCDGMVFMLRSLGYKVTISSKIGSYKKNGVRIMCKLAYRLYIQSDNNIELFKLERKRARSYQCRYERKKRILSIEKIGKKECQCITVDNPNGLYITNGFNVTHNSFNGIGALVLLHALYPQSRSCIIRKDAEVLRINTLPTCQKAIPTSAIKQYNGSENKWTFHNGSSMFFFAEGYEKDKDLNRWNGLEVNFIMMDQVEELQFDAWEKANERVGSYFIPKNLGKQPKPLIIMTVNPTQTWVKEEIYDRYMDGTLPKDWLYIPAKVTDNPHVEQSYLDQLNNLKKINPIKHQRFVMGDWEIQDNVDGAFYSSFDYDKHVGSSKDDLSVYYEPELALQITFDFNLKPYMTLLIWQFDFEDPDTVQGRLPRKKLNQIDEFCFAPDKNSTAHVCRAFKAKYYDHENGVFYYGDPMGKKDDTATEKGFNNYTVIKKELKHFHPKERVDRAAPPVAPRGEFINTIFRNQPEKDDPEGVGYLGLEIHIDVDCKKSIMDLTNVLEDADGSKMKKNTTDKKTKIATRLLTHTSDAMEYMIMRALRREFKEHQRGDVTSAHFHIPETRSTRF